MTDETRVSSNLKWLEVPDLRDPYLIAGFHGWSNAGSVSSDTLAYLKEFLQPRTFAVFSDEAFLNYTLDRPIGHIEDGIILHLESPAAELTCWTNSESDRDLILILDKEPHSNWSLYATTILEVIRRLGVKRLYTIGGVQDSLSHLAPVLVTVVGSSSYLVDGTLQLEDGIDQADYYGPVSIHSYLIKTCMEAGIEAVSLWGHVPAYLQRSPKAVAKLITILNKAVGMRCPIQSLRQQSVDLDRKVNEAIARDPNLKQLVESMQDKKLPAESPPGRDKIIRLNDFLHRDPKKDPES
ncbi:MAG TPA: PAC2 family protein [Desulfomonilaceae bacterium]|nr:PAC2 family protein [Desulfomonilaceae bacterium]